MAEETIRDLFRSSWLVERARENVYAAWADGDEAFRNRSKKAAGRAEIMAAALASLGRKTDDALVEAHTEWLRGLSGDRPGEVPLGDLFVSRIGNWVDSHAGPFLSEGKDELVALGDEERADIRFPTELPPPPGFEPVVSPKAEAPGEVLFRFGILGDLHFGSERGEMHARAAIDDLNSSGAELVIQLGDLTDHGNLDEFALAAKTLTALEMPLETIMGNHDIYSLEEARLSGREYYADAFGRKPDGKLIAHKDFRFALLDSATNAASPFAAFDFVRGDFLGGPGGAVVNGSITTPQHEILADVAAPDSGPAFVFLHHPPQPFAGFPPVLFGLRDADSGRLHATVDSGNVWGVFAGHTHRNKRTRDYGTVPAHEVAIARDYPFGYALVDVTANGYAYNFVQLSDEELLRDAYQYSGTIHRRYGLGTEAERSFVWTK
jgi:hypothetical protein